jgi:uncharacterized protein
MEHYYLGSKERKLYSVYYEPGVSVNNSKAVILCYPVGQEYIRCHRMYSNLANKLVKEGMHVVKFDYAGTGDSYGYFSSVSIEEWVSNIKEIADELVSGTGARQLYIVGVRMGALLAARYAEEGNVDGLVFLSPVFNGKTFLDEIIVDYKTWLDGSFARQRGLQKGQTECHGFLYSDTLCSELHSVTPGYIQFPLVPVLIIDEKEPLITGYPLISFSELVNKKLWKKNIGEDNKDILPIHEINLISNWLSRI